MSRIGKKEILIPKDVEISFDGNWVRAKGPKGELKFKMPEEILFETKEGSAAVRPKKEFVEKNTGLALKKINAKWGLSRSIIQGIIEGVEKGFEKKLLIEGIGYRASLEGKDLSLKVGFSHLVKVSAPEGISFGVEKNVIVVSGIDKQLVGQIAANIRKVQPPEPYKGKGIRYEKEIVRRKEGKKAATAAK